MEYNILRKYRAVELSPDTEVFTKSDVLARESWLQDKRYIMT